MASVVASSIGGFVVDIGGAIGTVKTIAAVVRESGKIELTQQVIDLQQTLLSLLAENAALTTKLSEARQRFDELLETVKLREAFYPDKNAYWKGDEEHRDGPFCTRCFDVEQKAVRLTMNLSNVGVCGNCKNTVRLDGPISPRPPQRTIVHPGWVRDW